MSKSKELKHLSTPKTWMRAAFMLLFLVLLHFATTAVMFLSIFQLLSSLLTGKPNSNLLKFTGSLSTYIYQVMQFLLYQQEKKPFPFDEKWPA